jgi:hypothetical protein
VTAANVSHLPVSSIFRLDRIPVFYEIKTTADWMAGGQARVCLTYNDENMTPDDEVLLKLLHEENGTTVDRTATLDIGANVICADVPSFSQVVPVTAKRTPVITWPEPAPIVEGTPLGASQLNATSSTAGSFTYSPPDGTVLSAGDHTLTAHFVPADTGNYLEATATVRISVTPEPGRMTAGGFTDTVNTRHFIEFDVRRDASGIASGRLQMRRHTGRGRSMASDRFQAQSVSHVRFRGHRVWFGGQGYWNGEADYAFTVEATDGGEPGRNDEVTIIVTAPNGSVVASVSGRLAGGNLQRH